MASARPAVTIVPANSKAACGATRLAAKTTIAAAASASMIRLVGTGTGEDGENPAASAVSRQPIATTPRKIPVAMVRWPAGQQDERDDRKDDQQVDGILALVGHARDGHRHQPDDQQDGADVDPPALGDRVAAVHELVELRPDESPAGAGPRRHAGVALLAAPYRVDERPVDDRRQGPGDEERRRAPSGWCSGSTKRGSGAASGNPPGLAGAAPAGPAPLLPLT